MENQELDNLKNLYPQGEEGGWQRALPVEPIERITYFKSEKNKPHWHIVTEGFRSLGETYELTLRVERSSDEKAPDMWVNRLFQRLAQYVQESGQGFTNYDYADLEGVETDKGMFRGVAFIPDSELAPNQAPDDIAQFLQVVLLTEDQLERMAGDSYMEFVEELQKSDPLFIQK